ncbi:hypothetical protein Ae201684P_016943 [Aphanomyces euteiches]|uniref:Uncharacterized protein n=1 Tax=Aphanomyces euteiches TaxID=100861 RepID=A0A6G0XJ00_9STRA|nr:hypothetical protein Ae201684_004362 [Aphanomyces euteiches]KAH9094333.1 hypothetical protein Ae201684P_016943 [Aphanomyces euteiches]
MTCSTTICCVGVCVVRFILEHKEGSKLEGFDGCCRGMMHCAESCRIMRVEVQRHWQCQSNLCFRRIVDIVARLISSIAESMLRVLSVVWKMQQRRFGEEHTFQLTFSSYLPKRNAEISLTRIECPTSHPPSMLAKGVSLK